MSSLSEAGKAGSAPANFGVIDKLSVCNAVSELNDDGIGPLKATLEAVKEVKPGAVIDGIAPLKPELVRLIEVRAGIEANMSRLPFMLYDHT